MKITKIMPVMETTMETIMEKTMETTVRAMEITTETTTERTMETTLLEISSITAIRCLGVFVTNRIKLLSKEPYFARIISECLRSRKIIVM